MAKQKVTTPSGFKCEFDAERINDIKVLRALRAQERGDNLAILDVVDSVFDAKTVERMEKFVEKDGKTAADDFFNLVGEIFVEAQSIKNS